MAFEVSPPQLIGPQWLADTKLDIIAKANGPTDEKQMHRMLRALLAERMGVKAHTEQRELPVFELTVLPGGKKFAESAGDGPAAFGRDKSGPAMLHVSMSELAVALSQQLGRPVIDKTELAGRYDIHLDMARYAGDANSGGGAPAPMDMVSVMINALRDQMGLKIDGRKREVPVVVVDYAEKTPLDN